MLGHKAIAFIRRDFIIESSYKFAFAFEILTTIVPVLSFYFIARLVRNDSPPLAKYGPGGYFPFAMIGVALTQYFMLALRTFADTVRRSQMAGCLEAMLSTRTRPETVILLSSLYSFLMKLFHVVLVFALSGWLLGVDFRQANFLSAAVVLVLTVVAFASLGILSAAVIVVLKKGDPIEWVLGSLSSLLGGAFFPVTVLPGWLQHVATALPTTHALEGMRLAVLRGYSIAGIWPQVAVLSGMALALAPLSVWTFSLAVEKGRRDGSLMHY